MASDDDDLWQALLAATGDQVATEADYEHGYERDLRSDLLRYVTFMIGGEIYGLPIEQIPILLTVDWFLDRCRTTINVLGDVNVSCILDGRTKPAAAD